MGTFITIVGFTFGYIIGFIGSFILGMKLADMC